MTGLTQPPFDTYQSLTFRERGLAVLFTTPLLGGARVRPGRRPKVLELVMPNPSGGRGAYVVEWDGVRELCQPTLHDTRLGTALESHHGLDGALTPAEVRRIGRDVLAQGFAGRPAAAAARAAMAGSARLAADAHRDLLVRLAGVATGDGGAHASALKAMVPIARDIGRDVECVANALERLAHVVAEFGLDATAPTGFVSRGLADLADLIGAVREAGVGQARQGSAMPAGAARFVVSSAELTLSLARRSAMAARARLADLPRALAGWAIRPAAILEAAARPEWLLDGWPRICLLSRALGGDGDPAATLAEMALLVPPLPPQADDWLGLPPGTAARANPPPHGLRAAWPGGAAMPDLVARNEQLLALAA